MVAGTLNNRLSPVLEITGDSSGLAKMKIFKISFGLLSCPASQLCPNHFLVEVRIVLLFSRPTARVT